MRVIGRRAVVAVSTAATALVVSSCGVVGGSSRAAEPTYVPPSTSTTAPSPSSKPSGQLPQRIPLGREILNDAKGQVRGATSVTIVATLPPKPGEEDVGPMTVISKGDTGGGQTDVEIRFEDGSSLHQRDIGGYNVYLKLERGDVERGLADSIKAGDPLVKNAGRWIRIYTDKVPLALRPHDIFPRYIRAGQLEEKDMRYAVADVRDLDGQEVYGVQVRPASKSSDNFVRTFWISPWTKEDGYRFLRMEAGTYPRKNTLVFSGWNTTPRKFPKPADAVQVKDPSQVMSG